jgi:hypothetical protein
VVGRERCSFGSLAILAVMMALRTIGNNPLPFNVAGRNR